MQPGSPSSAAFASPTHTTLSAQAPPPSSLAKPQLKMCLAEVTAKLEAAKLEASKLEARCAALESIKSAADTPDKMKCPITFERMRSPVVCADGHAFERAAIERWLATNMTNPATGKQLPHRFLNPSLVLRNEIREYEQETGRARPPPPSPASARRAIDPTLRGDALHALQLQIARQEGAAEERARAHAERERLAAARAAAQAERERAAEAARLERERAAEAARLERERAAEAARLERERVAEAARIEAARIERERQARLEREAEEMRTREQRAAHANNQRQRLGLSELAIPAAITWHRQYKAFDSHTERINFVRAEHGLPTADERDAAEWQVVEMRRLNMLEQQRNEAKMMAKMDKAARKAARKDERRAAKENRRF